MYLLLFCHVIFSFVFHILSGPCFCTFLLSLISLILLSCSLSPLKPIAAPVHFNFDLHASGNRTEAMDQQVCLFLFVYFSSPNDWLWEDRRSNSPFCLLTVIMLACTVRSYYRKIIYVFLRRLSYSCLSLQPGLWRFRSCSTIDCQVV
jgi:hypothetical protein